MKLAAHIRLAHEKLEHGLPCYIDKGEMRLRLPPHKCPNQDKRSPQRVRIPVCGCPFGLPTSFHRWGLKSYQTLVSNLGFVWGYTDSGR